MAVLARLVSSDSDACWNLAIPLGDDRAIIKPTAGRAHTAAGARATKGSAALHRLTRPKLAARRMAQPRAIWSYGVPGEPAGCRRIHVANTSQIMASAARPPTFQPTIAQAATACPTQKAREDMVQ